LKLFSPKRPLTIAESSIDNRKLDGFWDKFVNHPESCMKLCDECGYCRKYADASISKTDRLLMDIMKSMSRFALEDFPCVPGEFVPPLNIDARFVV